MNTRVIAGGTNPSVPVGYFVVCDCKIPEFSRNLIFIILVPAGIVVLTLTFNKGPCLFPRLIRD